MDNDKWIWNILHKIISRKWIGDSICKLLLRLDTLAYLCSSDYINTTTKDLALNAKI